MTKESLYCATYWKEEMLNAKMDWNMIAGGSNKYKLPHMGKQKLRRFQECITVDEDVIHSAMEILRGKLKILSFILRSIIHLVFTNFYFIHFIF